MKIIGKNQKCPQMLPRGRKNARIIPFKSAGGASFSIPANRIFGTIPIRENAK